MANSNAPEPGIYHGISMEDYLAIDYFHKSLVSSTLRSAAHLKLAKEEDKTTKPKVIGSLVDALLLDPKDLDRFGMLPETYINSKGKEMPFNLNSKDCRAEYDLLVSQGKTPIKLEQMRTARAIKDGVICNPTAAEMIERGKKQVTIIWDDPDYGVRCKARVDLQLEGELVDLKTTRDAEKQAFSRQMVYLGYHIQAAMYLDAWAQLNGGQVMSWKFIAAENEAPFCSAVYELDEDGIDAGRVRYKMALARYKDYMESDPDLMRGYSEFIEPITIPKWELTQAFKEGDDANVPI